MKPSRRNTRNLSIRIASPLTLAIMTIAFLISGKAGTFEVFGPGGDGRSLQQVIDQAKSGDSIVVSDGVFEGNILLEKRITLLGIDMPVLRGTGLGSVVTITADSCLLRGFVIEHSGAMLVEEDAGIILRSDHNTLEQLRLRDVLFGIYLWGADRNLISDNLITGRPELGIGERGSGMHVYSSHNNRFLRNKVSDVRDGFYIQYANLTLIEGCEVFHVRYGLHYMYADSNTFLRNNFHDNLAGAAIMYSRGIRMRLNAFTDNNGFSSYGILFQDCHDLEADSNIIADNGIGMFLEASTGNLFRHNLIIRNTIALQMFQNSTENIFSGNDFIDNLSPLSIVGRRTESRWSFEGRGNYWSTYEGYDLDHDGVGDVPMKIQNVFQYLEGQNPGARLYLYSPASQALALAANTFPILDRNEEFDPSPLMKPEAARHGMITPVAPEGRNEGAAGWAVLPVAGLLFGGFVYYRVSRKNE